MTVYLVGAGPGDPGLITVRGAELLARAEVVLFDRLASPTLLSLVPAGAELISAGKAPGSVDLTQEQTNALLVEKGLTGAEVVRLKGGDPYVFGRGGEEAEALAAAGVPFEVVPGITSAIGAATYAGIPVTHRGVSTHFTVVTGHEDPTKGTTDVNWSALAKVGGTLVILMGAGRLHDIAQALIDGGRDADTPVAAVRNGTRPDQHTVRGTLGTIAWLGVRSPSAIVVGGVAGLDFSWFEQRPLFGRSVVVTRAREQASELTARLESLGPRWWSCRRSRWSRWRSRCRRSTTWRGWCSRRPTGCDAFFDDGLAAAGLDARALAGTRVAVIGPGTERALAARGVRADLVPERFVAESLLAAFPDPDGAGRARARRARRTGARRVARGARGAGLRGRGAPRVSHRAGHARSGPTRAGAPRRRRRDHVHVVVDRHQPL